MVKRRIAACGIALLLIVATTLVVRDAGPAFRHPITAFRLIAAAAPTHLPVPVAGVRASDITDSWGSPRPGGRHHQGVDIFAPRGRQIVSSTPGIVVTVGTNRLGGRIVRVLGPAGYWHYYAHLDSYGSIHEGEFVTAGTVLGYVGNSGDAVTTPTHLHYGIYRLRGGAINPFPLIRATRVNSAATDLSSSRAATSLRDATE